MTATPENRVERIESFVGVDYDDTDCKPVTQRTADVAKEILRIVGTTQPGVYPVVDDSSGGISIEWTTKDHQVIIEVPNSEQEEFGTGEIYWLLKKGGDDDEDEGTDSARG